MAYDKAVEAAKEIDRFTKKHPIWTIVIALCIVRILYPTAIKALGFKLGGVVKGYELPDVKSLSLVLAKLSGPYAASWQSTYGAILPAGSLFSCLQHLRAMTAF